MTPERWHCLRPIQPISANWQGQQPAGAGEQVHHFEGDHDAEEQDEIICGQCEDPPVKVAKDPGMPSERGVEEHFATHLPHKSWCPVCIKARGKEDPHKKIVDKGEKPTVSMEYKSFEESAEEGDKVTMIVAKCESTGTVAAHICDQKGAADKWIIGRVCNDIDILGHTEIILKGDGEPALVQLQGVIKERRTHPTVCQNPPAYNPQSNRAAERAARKLWDRFKQ